MVGEIKPGLPERELPLEDFGRAAAPPEFDDGLSLMMRDELTGLEPVVLLTDGDCGASLSLPFDMPYPSGTHEPPLCWQSGHEFICKP